ncbi:replication initiation protein, partial [Xanthovirga aplysinae]|uniref:replication initiation protein n=1 Tax=Xanthovirga aplysinae TaxID=2529853 RepID=UPI0012BC49AC
LEQSIATQDNAFTESRHNLKALEIDIFTSLLVQVNNMKLSEEEERELEKATPLGSQSEKTYLFYLDIKDLEKISGKEYVTKRMLKYAQNLRDVEIYFQDDNREALTGLISKAELIDNSILRLTVDRDIIRIAKKKTDFTLFYNIESLKLNSTFAKRIYQMCMRYKGLKKLPNARYEPFNVLVEDLKSMLNVEEKYPLYGNFKQKVLNVALREINEKTFLKVEVKEHKNGRKTERLEFFIEKNESNINKFEQLYPSSTNIKTVGGKRQKKQKENILDPAKIIKEIIDTRTKDDSLNYSLRGAKFTLDVKHYYQLLIDMGIWAEQAKEIMLWPDPKALSGILSNFKFPSTYESTMASGASKSKGGYAYKVIMNQLKGNNN